MDFREREDYRGPREPRDRPVKACPARPVRLVPRADRVRPVRCPVRLGLPALPDHPDPQETQVRAVLPDSQVRPARLVRQAPRWLALPASLQNL